MKTNSFVTKIVKFLGAVLVALLFTGVLYFLYPIPRAFWNLWHSNDFREIETLSEKFGKNTLLSKELRCWEVANYRCGIELTFTSKLSLSEFKTKVGSLGLKNKYDSEIDEGGLFWILESRGMGLLIKERSTLR